MATEAPPKQKTAGDRSGGGARTRTGHSDERVIWMSKTSPELDAPRLVTYQELGYTVTEESWRYKMVGSQAEFEKRQKEYQQRGIAQAERVSKGRDAEGLDNPRESTISTVSRVPMTADDILGDDPVTP